MISSGSRAGAIAGAVVGAALGWGWFEAGWVRLKTLDVTLPRLPQALDGMRLAHLSDFHLGLPSRGTHAVERAVEWVSERDPARAGDGGPGLAPAGRAGIARS